MGKLRSTFIFSCQGLWEQPFYTILMAFTFGAVFCAAFTSMILITGGRAAIEKGLNRLGRDLIHVHNNPSPQFFFSPSLTFSDLERCRKATGGKVSAVRARQVAAKCSRKKTEVSAVLLGTDQAWPILNRSRFVSGRFFKENEKNCCALDEWVSEQLFGTVNSAGKILKIKSGDSEKELRVSGVIKDPLSIRKRLQGLDVLHGARPLLYRLLEGRNIYVPLSFFGPGNSIMFCLVRPGKNVDIYDAVRRLKKAFGKRSNSLIFWARGIWIDMIFKALNVGYIFSDIVWIMFLCLGGGMIMTVSFLSVSYREMEIGIRRTQGASQWEICGQILLEGFMISAAGALIGTIVTPFVGAWLARHLPWDFSMQPGTLCYVITAGIFLAVLSFFIPAYRVSRLEPVEVLSKK